MPLVRLDLLGGQKRVVDGLALKIAIAHDLRATRHLGVEGERALHVLDRQAEMLHAPQTRPERTAAQFGDTFPLHIADLAVLDARLDAPEGEGAPRPGTFRIACGSPEAPRRIRRSATI